MTRYIALGNQRLLVNIDRWLQVRDIYYPHVGQYNHLVGHAHKMIVLEGERASWVDSDDWEKDVHYLNETLITNSSATNDDMRLGLALTETVDSERDIFIRKVEIINHSDDVRNLRICFHHDFHLYADGIGDTAFFDPERKALIHYKKACYFLIGICYMEGSALSDYDIGEHVAPSQAMKKNPIAQGEVDSIIAADIEIQPNEKKEICYYLAAGKGFKEVHDLQDRFLRKGAHWHLSSTQTSQRVWLSGIRPDIGLLDERLQRLYKRSILIIQTQIDSEGAITAANDSDNMQFNKDTYSYMWPRDGALVAIALIKAGFPEMTKPFFAFCRDVLYEEGCLLHKYNPDRTLGSSWHPWVLNGERSLPIQEDETALVLHSLWIYYLNTNDKQFILSLYKDLIKPMGDFLYSYRYEKGLPRESYDLWEERRGIFTYTTATVVAGLIAAKNLAGVIEDKAFCLDCHVGYDTIKKALVEHLYDENRGYFRRSVSFEQGEIIYDNAIDSSSYALFEFGVLPEDDERVVSNMKRIKEWLWIKTRVGGIARYHDDYYHRVSDDIDNIPGNPWFICTLWYAKWVIRIAKKEEDMKEALDILNWVADHALSTGVLAEQVHPKTGDPLSVSPLTWSHAEFVDTMTNYVEKLKYLRQS